MKISKAFTPSSGALMAMIASAEARFEADRQQAALRKEARDERRMERAWAAEVAQRNRRFWTLEGL